MTVASHCVYCSTRIAPGASTCSACHMQVASDNARVADGARCPRCKARNILGANLTRRAVTEEASVLECASCGGAFIEPHAWSALLEAVLANDPRTQDLLTSSRAELPGSELFNLLQCPGCNRELDRLAFAGRSKISIDVCVSHGDWFDAGELAKVLAVARYKNDHAGALPVDDEGTPEERRAKVLSSMGIDDPDLHVHRAAINYQPGFSANRLGGRVAFVAGGLEGAAAYHVLRAVAAGSGKAFGWAVSRGSHEDPSLPTPSQPVVRQARFGAELPPLRCLFCGASHKESDAACVVCHAPISRVVCPACHSLIAAGEVACGCGAPLLSHAADDQMACPRCKSALDRISLDENTVAHRCRRCLGSFFDIHDWSALIDRTVAGSPLPLANYDAVPPGRELPKSILVEGAACSRCRRPMERITFAARSQVVVDICASHGMWLDAGELVALCTFMKAGPR